MIVNCLADRLSLQASWSRQIMQEQRQHGGPSQFFVPPLALLSLVAGMLGRNQHTGTQVADAPSACSAPEVPSIPDQKLGDLIMPKPDRRREEAPFEVVDREFFERTLGIRRNIEWLKAVTGPSWRSLMRLREFAKQYFSGAIAEMEKAGNTIETEPCPRILADPKSFKNHVEPSSYSSPEEFERSLSLQYKLTLDRLHSDLVGIFVEYAAWQQMFRVSLKALPPNLPITSRKVAAQEEFMVDRVEQALTWLYDVERERRTEELTALIDKPKIRYSFQYSDSRHEGIFGELFTPYLNCRAAKMFFSSRDPWRVYRAPPPQKTRSIIEIMIRPAVRWYSNACDQSGEIVRPLSA